MDKATWTAIQEAFDAATDLDGTARLAFLAELRARDPDLSAHVEALLRSDAAPHSLFDGNTGERAALLSPLLVQQNDARRADETSQVQARIASELTDRYTVLGELGRGGMAVVFSGIEQKHDRRVAIKVMRPSVADRVDRRRFGVEIRLTAQLAHPHIVPLYDSGEADGLPYYVTAEVPGASLAAHLAAHGPLPVEAAQTITRGIAAALGYAHQRKILHRDVKPSNILLHDQIALLTDFGIAKALTVEDATLTQAGHVLGTPRYMSPEQLRNADVDERADLFALGLVVYEMLTGIAAVSGTTPFEIIASHLEEAIPPPRAHRPELPDTLDTFFARALDADPQHRFASAYQFTEALDAALAGAPTKIATSRLSSVAVLPFDNHAPGGTDEYLSDGISEQLIHHLASVDSLRVVARASSFAFKDQPVGVREIGQRLGVHRIVTGSVRRAGDRLRITAELVETETESSVWSAQVEREMSDVFAMQDEVASAVVAALREHLGLAVVPSSPSTHVVPDARAYDAYLRARHAIFSFTDESLHRALDHLDRGLAILPNNPTLLAAKGYVHWQFVNAGIEPDPAHLGEAAALAERITTLDPTSHHANRLRGLVAIHQGSPGEAIGYLEQALAVHPTDTDAAFWLTLLLGFRGQPHRVEPYVAMMLTTDPLNPLHQMLPGFLALMRGQPAAAPGAFRTALAMEPGNPVLRLGCGQAEAMAGETDTALATLRPLDTFPPGMLFAGLGRLLRRGLGEGVPALTEEEAEAAASDLQWCWTAAQGYALAGDLNEANQWLQRAVDLGFVNYPLAALYDPLLRPLRGTDAFEALLAALEPAWVAQLPQPDFSGTTNTPLT
ncbi:MAG: protein kinase [Rhodothermaceae bacterium]|nr:protein kinase [Rhodothermaceae bacterium]